MFIILGLLYNLGDAKFTVVEACNSLITDHIPPECGIYTCIRPFRNKRNLYSKYETLDQDHINDIVKSVKEINIKNEKIDDKKTIKKLKYDECSIKMRCRGYLIPYPYE